MGDTLISLTKDNLYTFRIGSLSNPRRPKRLCSLDSVFVGELWDKLKE